MCYRPGTFTTARPKEKHGWYDVDFQKPQSPSALWGHAVYEAIFCDQRQRLAPRRASPKLVSQLLSLLQPYYVPCDDQNASQKNQRLDGPSGSV